MTIADDIGDALPELRVEAESLMVDTCTITVPGTGRGPWNDAQDRYDPPPAVTLYTGKCKVQDLSNQPVEIKTAETDLTLVTTRVDLPITGPGYQAGHNIPDGAAVHIDTVGPLSDPALAGADFTVAGPRSKKTWATARRLFCQEVG